MKSRHGARLKVAGLTLLLVALFTVGTAAATAYSVYRAWAGPVGATNTCAYQHATMYTTGVKYGYSTTEARAGSSSCSITASYTNRPPGNLGARVDIYRNGGYCNSTGWATNGGYAYGLSKGSPNCGSGWTYVRARNSSYFSTYGYSVYGYIDSPSVNL